MRQVALAYVLLFISVTFACSKSALTQTDSQKTNLTDSQKTKPVDAELQNQLAQIASAAKGRVGVAVLLLETSETVSLNSQDHFPMQSVYKLPIGMAVMKQVDAGKIKLDQKVGVTKDDFIGRTSHSPIRDKYPKGVELSVSELLAWMLLKSDGTASDGPVGSTRKMPQIPASVNG